LATFIDAQLLKGVSSQKFHYYQSFSGSRFESLEDELLNAATVLNLGRIEVSLFVGGHVTKSIELAGPSHPF
jgi:hypothetical protein